MNTFFKSLNALNRIADDNQTIPATVIAKWVTDYDIFGLDRIIRKTLDKEKDRLSALKKDKRDLEALLKGIVITVDKVSVVDSLEIIDKEIKNIEQKPNEYKTLSIDYLETYKYLKEKKISDLMPIVIEEYLQFAKKYYPHQVDRVQEKSRSDICPKCNIPLNAYEDDEDDRGYCSKCYVIFEGCFENTKVVHSSRKKDYDPIGNFCKIIAQFCGEVEVEFNKKFWDDFDKKRNDAKLQKEKMSRKDVMDVLKKTPGGADYYIHFTRIAYEYCAIALPDINLFREDVIEDYKIFYPVYDAMEKDRDSALNGLFVLFKLLEKNGYQCCIDDVKPSISEETLRKYDILWKAACTPLEWTYIPSI